MNKWKSNKGLKVIWVIISFLAAVLAAFSVAAVAVIQGLGAYYEPKEELLERLYYRYEEIYTVMAMANRESPGMLEEIDKTNFRYGIIKDDDTGPEGTSSLADMRLSDPGIYEYCNFEEMPDKSALENGEFTVREFEIGEGTRYSWDCSLFGYANIYQQMEDDDYWAESMEQVDILGYYYNVADGIFYYETEDEFYRVDEVALSVGVNGEGLRFVYDPGQEAYYNTNPEACWIKDYYLTFDAFDDRECSWETWQQIELDGRGFGHTDIRFISDEDSDSGELQGKPISQHYYFMGDGNGVLCFRTEDKNAGEAQKNTMQKYWVISQVREPLLKTGIRDGVLEGDLFEQGAFMAELAYTWRIPAVVILIISLILWVGSTVFVLIMAGHKGSMEIVEILAGAEEDTDAELPEDRESSVRTESRWVDAVRTGLRILLRISEPRCFQGLR